MRSRCRSCGRRLPLEREEEEDESGSGAYNVCPCFETDFSVYATGIKF